MINRISALFLITSFFLFCQTSLVLAADTKSNKYDEASAYDYSQAAIGTLVGDHVFTDQDGKKVQLSDYLGKPLIISMVYTSCHHICPTTTRYLAKAVRNARAALGADSFNIITIGFDTANDTPGAMRTFSRTHKADIPGWKFLSTNKTTIALLSKEVGFLFYTSPKGFDHLLQSTLIDKSGKVYGQVYGIGGSTFDTPLLVEPLKNLVYGISANDSLLNSLSNRIRLFCTIYDPASGAYYFDYSLFVGLAIGLLILSSIIFWLVKEWRLQRRNIS